ncbi:hypothetical protein ACF0H5_011792 [Mactra antiquata]
MYNAYHTIVVRKYLDRLFITQRNVTVSDQTYVEVTTLPSDIQHNWERNETQMLEIFVLSAIGINCSIYDGYQAEFKLSGWMASKHSNTVIKCCIIMNSGALIEYYRPFRCRGRNISLTSSQITCPIQSPLQDVKGIALQFAGRKCQQKNIKPSVPIKPTNNESFAICLKILFGQVDVGLLVEWLEYNRLIGVDKIFMFTYNITREVSDVLKQYINVGFVEKRPYSYPSNKEYQVGEKLRSYWEDEQVVVYDCYQRLSLYRYISIIDMDEFIVPRKHDNIKDMMRYLMTIYPRAGGFSITPYLFLKNVHQNISSVKNNSNIGRYFERTRGLKGAKSRTKNIVLPSRISTKGYHTHRFLPVLDYKKYRVMVSVTSLNHYRYCYSNLQNLCNGSLIKDTYILKFFNRLKEKTQIVYYN